MSSLNEIYRGLEIQVDYASNPEDPREWDPVTRMVCFHRRYNLGDSHDYNSDDYAGWDEIEDQIFEDHNPVWIKPLYLYDHSGITISTSPFGCRWDSGQIGWVFITKERYEECFGKFEGTESEFVDKCCQIIESEVKTYDDYIRGEVYRFEVNDEDGEFIDACCGYYGQEGLEYGLDEFKKTIDYHLDRKQRKLQVLNTVQLRACLA